MITGISPIYPRPSQSNALPQAQTRAIPLALPKTSINTDENDALTALNLYPLVAPSSNNMYMYKIAFKDPNTGQFIEKTTNNYEDVVSKLLGNKKFKIYRAKLAYPGLIRNIFGKATESALTKSSAEASTPFYTNPVYFHTIFNRLGIPLKPVTVPVMLDATRRLGILSDKEVRDLMTKPKLLNTDRYEKALKENEWRIRSWLAQRGYIWTPIGESNY